MFKSLNCNDHTEGRFKNEETDHTLETHYTNEQRDRLTELSVKLHPAQITLKTKCV